MEDLFKVKIIFPVTSKVNPDDEDDNEISEVDRMKYDLSMGYEIGIGYWDLTIDPIAQTHPRCVLKKGSERKTYYTEVVFQSNNTAYAACKPEELKKQIDEYSSEPK